MHLHIGLKRPVIVCCIYNAVQGYPYMSVYTQLTITIRFDSVLD